MVVTADGSKVKYDYLIVAVGLKIAYEKVTLSTVHTISSVHDITVVINTGPSSQEWASSV